MIVIPLSVNFNGLLLWTTNSWCGGYSSLQNSQKSLLCWILCPSKRRQTVSKINNCTVFKTRAVEKNKAGERDRASCNGIRMTYLKREAWKFSRGRCYLSKDPKEVMEPVSGSDQRNELIWLSSYQDHSGYPLRIDTRGDESLGYCSNPGERRWWMGLGR